MPLIRGIYESTKTKADVATVETGSEAPIAFDKKSLHGIMVSTLKVIIGLTVLKLPTRKI